MTVGPGCLVANQVVVYEGVRLGAGCVIEDRVRIGYDSTIGERTRNADGPVFAVDVELSCRITVPDPVIREAEAGQQHGKAVRTPACRGRPAG
ncbi:MAG: hypothetical protein ACRDTC_00020 [Pseudonocardiaceae bacterium]